MTDKANNNKEKINARRNRLMLTALLIPIFALVLFLIYLLSSTGTTLDEIFAPVDADLSTPLCDFASDSYLIIPTHPNPYITNIEGSVYIPLPSEVYTARWLEDAPILLGAMSDSHYSVNLDTGDLIVYGEYGLNSQRFDSMSSHQSLYWEHDGENLHKIMLIDNLKQEIIWRSETLYTHALWSPSENVIFMHSFREPGEFAEIITLEPYTLTTIDLPDDVYKILDWADENTLIYQSTDQYLYQWNPRTQDKEKFTDAQFGESYMAGGLEYFPGIQISVATDDRQFGGIDTTDTFHLFDLTTNEHFSFPLDTSEAMSYIIRDHYVMFIYGAMDARSYVIYTPKTNTSTKYDSPTEQLGDLSHDSKYRMTYFRETETHRRIQNILSGETFNINEEVINWESIDNQPYIFYRRPAQNGANVFYLLHPETKVSCKIGTFHTKFPEIQNS